MLWKASYRSQEKNLELSTDLDNWRFEMEPWTSMGQMSWHPDDPETTEYPSADNGLDGLAYSHLIPLIITSSLYNLIINVMVKHQTHWTSPEWPELALKWLDKNMNDSEWFGVQLILRHIETTSYASYR